MKKYITLLGLCTQNSTIKPHELRSKHEESIQGIGHELSGKQMADVGPNSIVLAFASIPQPLKQFDGDILSDEPGGMGPTSGPVNPSQRPVGISLGEFDSDQGGKVVFVHVTGGLAVFLEDGEVFVVGDDGGGDASVHFEPLGALAPLLELDCGPHTWAVAATADWAGEVVGLDEGGFGAH